MDKAEILGLLSEQQITPAQAKALLLGQPMPIAAVVREQLQANGSTQTQEDIAIVGLALNLPGAETKEQYWQNLLEGRCAVNNLSKTRWQQPQYQQAITDLTARCGHWGGFLADIDSFDHRFFNITAQDAETLDPQHRLLLQTSWHAVEDAGLNKADLAGSQTGVYIGINEADFSEHLETLQGGPLDHLDGILASFAAGRLSYFYDLKGPALNIDTACSSSLVALHTGCQAIKNGDCTMAIIGGTTVANTPSLFLRLNNLGIVSNRGRCAPFDQQADGTILGEGIVALVCLPLSKAKQQNHHIHAVIKATASNQDGRSNGISAPNAAAQQMLLKSVYGPHGIDPASIGYFETHGTGTNLGDPVELNAIIKTFAPANSTATLGSVKANIGHTAQTAGLAGLAKVVMALSKRIKPPQIHFDKLNEKIALADSRLKISTHAEPWSSAQPRRAAINSFGIMGTNAHAVIEEYLPPAPDNPPGQHSHYLILLSAQSRLALDNKINQLATFIKQNPATSLADIAHTLAARREHWRPWRLALVVSDLAALYNTLQMQGDELPKGNSLTADLSALLQEITNNPADAGPPLTALASAYLNKQALDWRQLYPNGSYQPLSLPQYPFDRKQPEPAEQADDTNQVYFLFAKYLGIAVDELEHDATFDELGIDSISLMKVAAMLQIKFSMPITVETLIEYDTPKAMLSFVEGMEYEAKIDTNLSINLEPDFDFYPWLPELSAGVFEHPQLGRQEYMIGGRGLPILLMPPVDCPASAWIYQIRHLVDRYKVIVMHYPGYGHSEFRGFKVSFDEVADLVPALLDHLQITQADLVGWSQGGLISQKVAARHPARIKKLLLANTAAYLNYMKNSESIERLINIMKDDFNSFEHKIAEKLGVSSLASFIKGSTSNTVFLNYAREILNHNSTVLLENVKAPTWIVAGKNDELTTLAHAEVLRERIEGAQLIVHPSAGHYIPLANARYFNQKLDEFMAFAADKPSEQPS